MRGEVLGVERRRRWSDEEKLEIVSSVGVDGPTVTRVAQRNDITRQQVYTFSEEDVAGIMGNNWLTFYDENFGPYTPAA